MSIDRCRSCGCLVDTDADPDAYVDLGNQRGLEDLACLCCDCRERIHEEREAPVEPLE